MQLVTVPSCNLRLFSYNFPINKCVRTYHEIIRDEDDKKEKKEKNTGWK